MLIVIGILAILLGLLYGSLERARKFSRYTIAYNEVKQIQAAFEQYHAHYGCWPTATNNPALTTFFTGAHDDEGFVITRDAAYVLHGVSAGNQPLFDTLNPEGLPFIEFTRFEPQAAAQGAPCNPFKPASQSDTTRRFAVMFDADGDRQIEIPASVQGLPDSTSTNIIGSVAVWTFVPGFYGETQDKTQPAGDQRLGSWEPFDLKRREQ